MKSLPPGIAALLVFSVPAFRARSRQGAKHGPAPFHGTPQAPDPHRNYPITRPSRSPRR